MTTYDSVTNRIVIPTFPAGSVAVGTCTISYGAYTPEPPPSSITRSYEPYVESRRLYDPSKGRKWSALKKTGAILFSPYENSLEKVTSSISSRNKLRHIYYQITGDCLSSPPVCHIGTLVNVKPSWTENDDFSSLSERLLLVGRPRSDYDGTVEDTISSTQQSAFSQALNAYDLLTEIGELRETVGFFGSKIDEVADLMSKFADKDRNAWSKGRRSTAKTLMRSSDVALRTLGKRWMEYRYAIMPLLYSFNDVSKLLNEKANRYQSDRSRQRISLDYDPGEPLGNETLDVKSSGEIIVRSLTKGRFDMGDLQKLVSTVGLNPFRTAWELIPLSYVVDWILNVGDAITSLTGLDYSSERLGTTSVREKSIFTYTHHDRFTLSVAKAAYQNSCGQTVPGRSDNYDEKFDNVVRLEERDTYVRTIWTRPMPKIIFDPFLNWKRLIDSFVLGYQPTKKTLRSLR